MAAMAPSLDELYALEGTDVLPISSSFTRSACHGLRKAKAHLMNDSVTVVFVGFTRLIQVQRFDGAER